MGQIQCLASHLTYFAAGFVVPPNTINFSTIFSRVASELADNFVVLATLLGILAAYYALALLLRYADKADALKVGINILTSYAQDVPNYLFSIV